MNILPELKMSYTNSFVSRHPPGVDLQTFFSIFSSFLVKEFFLAPIVSVGVHVSGVVRRVWIEDYFQTSSKVLRGAR